MQKSPEDPMKSEKGVLWLVVHVCCFTLIDPLDWRVLTGFDLEHRYQVATVTKYPLKCNKTI